MRTKLLVSLLIAFGLHGCAHQKTAAQADPVQEIQRNLAKPDQCARTDVTYCAAHGSKAKDGLCQCVKQQDARSTLDNLN